MCSKIVWCYVFVLTVSDISLNTKLSAQGKSHGVTVHESLIEGLTFQEWGGAAGGEAGVSLRPAALGFGRLSLSQPHARSVTLTNRHNTTLHLASVAGTTPDFHASFFEAKTLPPQGNTTFSVVYLGRREGPVAAQLYIHTSLGVHHYPVSAVGVASAWDVWPLVGVRVPHNATLDPLLTIHNPTDHTVQVREVYSSGAWLRLSLPEGGGAAPRASWALPPHATRPLVRLQLQPPAHLTHALTAYIRIKGDMEGGALVVAVEARSVPAGPYPRPLQLRLRPRGSGDPPYEVQLQAGNSGAAGARVAAGAWAARCSPAPHAPPPPPDPSPAQPATANGQPDKPTANGAAGGAGVSVTALRDSLPPLQAPTAVAALQLNFGEMWAGAAAEGGSAWCAGWLRLGGAALPYSVRLLPGTLALLPAVVDFIIVEDEETGTKADMTGEAREVRVRNDFSVPVLVTSLHVPDDVQEYFDVETLTPVALGGGAEALVAVVRTQRQPPPLLAALTLHTNLSDYTLPLRVYSPRFTLEWEWPNSTDGSLRLGTLGTSSTRRVGLRLRNDGPAPLCVAELRADLPGAQLALAPGQQRCVEGGGRGAAWLTVVAPAREGGLAGWVRVWSPPGAARAPVELRALPGRLRAQPLQLPPAAPYVWSRAPLVVESSMAARMAVLGAAPAGDPARPWAWLEPAPAAHVAPGRRALGSVVLAPERLCQPACYTGLSPDTPEGAAWLRRGAASLEADAALQRARHALYRARAGAVNVSLHLHTSLVLQLPVAGAAAAAWPALLPAPPAPGLAAVGLRAPLRLLLANPSHDHPLLLHAVLSDRRHPLGGAEESSFCSREQCVWSRDVFRLEEWRATRGEVREWPPGSEADPASPAPPAGSPAANASHALPMLLLAPAAEVEIKLSFAPTQPAALAAILYLRNNLTVVEAAVVSGRGALPSFELAGRRPGAAAPFLFEVSECPENGAPLRRTVVARNTGRVAVRLRDWRLAGQPCQARGFAVQPCAPLVLQPNESRALTLAFHADCTLARVSTRLTLRTDTAQAEFSVGAQTAARLLARCGARLPRPPFEPALRAAGTLLALAAFVLVLAAAALDAERELRRARAARAGPPHAPRRPLDLRAAHRAPPPPTAPPPPLPPRRRRTPRRPLPALDPQAERRAFERWRAEVLRRAEDNGSSEDADGDAPPLAAPPPAPPQHFQPGDDAADTGGRAGASGDEDAASTGSSGACSLTASSSSSSASSPAERDAEDPEDGDAEDYTAEDYSPDVELEDGEDSERAPAAAPSASPRSPPRAAPPAAAPGRAARREPGDAPRRAPPERGRGPERAKPHARKDKCPRRRSGAAAAPARASPPAPPERAPPALRWGASWSSVVAAGGAALAPIGSDVRRRAAPDRFPADNSLFYYNDPQHAAQPEHAWRAPAPPAPFRADTTQESAVSAGVGAGAGGFGAVGGVGGAWEAAWWGAVRPPPGFGAAPRAVRPYDPFHSLAAIWAPGAAPPWRRDDDDPPAAPH